MFGWFMRASSSRSERKRARMSSLSMPALITFSATWRRTGSNWSARYTAPIPPTPSCAVMRYTPMRRPISENSGSLPRPYAGNDGVGAEPGGGAAVAA